MKTKRFLVAFCLVSILFAAFVTPASATFYYCNVIQVGPGASTSYIQLSACDGTFTNVYFTINSAAENKLLAASLTALSTGNKVFANVTGTAAYSELTNMYVMDQPKCTLP